MIKHEYVIKTLLSLFAVVSTMLCADERILLLGTLGNVRYTYNNAHLLQIDRISPSGQILYTHSYSWDQDGHLVAENLIGDLGTVKYTENFMIQSPYNIS